MTVWRTSPLPRAWPAIRRRILERDGHCCTVTGCGAPATDVDHILSAHLGGGDDDTNLASLCRAHHRLKTSREANAIDRPGRYRSNRRPPEAHPGLT